MESLNSVRFLHLSTTARRQPRLTSSPQTRVPARLAIPAIHSFGQRQKRQPVRRGERSPDVTPSVALHLGMIFKPEHEAFFELSTERLTDSGARFEARNSPRTGAPRYY